LKTGVAAQLDRELRHAPFDALRLAAEHRVTVPASFLSLSLTAHPPDLKGITEQKILNSQPAPGQQGVARVVLEISTSLSTASVD